VVAVVVERDKKVQSPKFLDSDFNIAHMIMFSRSSGFANQTVIGKLEPELGGGRLNWLAKRRRLISL